MRAKARVTGDCWVLGTSIQMVVGQSGGRADAADTKRDVRKISVHLLNVYF